MNEEVEMGNLRWSDLTWRRSWLPQGQELSVTAGVSMLFPGPLAQVRQKTSARGKWYEKQSNVISHIPH